MKCRRCCGTGVEPRTTKPDENPVRGRGGMLPSNIEALLKADSTRVWDTAEIAMLMNKPTDVVRTTLHRMRLKSRATRVATGLWCAFVRSA